MVTKHFIELNFYGRKTELLLSKFVSEGVSLLMYYT